MLKEFLRHTSQYLTDDVIEWIFKQPFQGSKNDYWDVLSITTNLFYWYLFRKEGKINYKKFHLWFRKNPLYLTRDDVDKTINDFLHIHENRRDSAYRDYLKKMTWKIT